METETYQLFKCKCEHLTGYKNYLKRCSLCKRKVRARGDNGKTSK